jgi:hypothetical protein
VGSAERVVERRGSYLVGDTNSTGFVGKALSLLI